MRGYNCDALLVWYMLWPCVCMSVRHKRVLYEVAAAVSSNIATPLLGQRRPWAVYCCFKSAVHHSWG